jgi:integrase
LGIRSANLIPVRGHLEGRGRNVWRVKVFLGRDPSTGQQQYLTRTVHGTKREAETEMNQLLAELGRGAHSATSGAGGTLADLAARFLELNSDRLSPTTVRGYRQILDRYLLPALGSRKVRSLRPADLDEFYAQLLRSGGAGGRTLSAQSVHHVHALLRRLLNQASKWGWCAVSPAAKASPPRVIKHEIKPPAPADVQKLLAAADERDEDLSCFLRLAVVTGARRGELCALRWRDVDLAAGGLSISRAIVAGDGKELVEKGTKTHASRRVMLDSETVELLAARLAVAQGTAAILEAALATNAFVFSDAPDGSEPWRPNRVTLAFNRLCKRAGVAGVRLHDLRHFAATRLLVAGVPVKTVAGRLGHANAATTLNVYAHVVESSDAEAAQVLGDLLRRPE